MRLDYFHTGGMGQEVFALDEVVIEPAPWAGPDAPVADTLRSGAYGFDVRDAATKQPIYSAGFGSIFDEWTTTDEAGRVSKTFHESLRFPAPASPVVVTVRKRGLRDTWTDVWTLTVDPSDMFVNPAAPVPGPGPVIAIDRRGDPARKVDLLLIGDGYTAAERGKFERDARRLADVLF